MEDEVCEFWTLQMSIHKIIKWIPNESSVILFLGSLSLGDSALSVNFHSISFPERQRGRLERPVESLDPISQPHRRFCSKLNATRNVSLDMQSVLLVFYFPQIYLCSPVQCRIAIFPIAVVLLIFLVTSNGRKFCIGMCDRGARLKCTGRTWKLQFLNAHRLRTGSTCFACKIIFAKIM